MDSPTRPSALFVYYTHTRQTLKVVEAMSDALRERGYAVSQAGIEFTRTFANHLADELPAAAPAGVGRASNGR